MPLWLQIIGLILGAAGAVFGVVNIVVQWCEKNERLHAYWVHRELRIFGIYNPTPRPVQVIKVVFETWDKDDKTWHQRVDGTLLKTEPFILMPYTAEEFTLSSGQNLDLSFDKLGRVRVRTASSKEFVEIVNNPGPRK